MDLSLLPTPVSEHNRQRAGACFTIRSANSPSYSLIRRPAVRKSRTFSEAETGSMEDATKTETCRKHTGTNGANREDDTFTEPQAGPGGIGKGLCEEKETTGHKMSTVHKQNSAADKTITDVGVDRGFYSPSESRGRAEWREYNLVSRSRSLDCRRGARSPDWDKGLPSKQGSDISKQERTGAECVKRSMISSIKAYNSSGTSNVQERILESYTKQTLDKVSRGHSLPSRQKSLPAPCSGFRETASFGPKGGQSISDRIEKLYGSFIKTEDCNKFRGVSPPVRDWCDTRSLDRGRSRYTAAAQIRADRAARGITAPPQPNSFLEETSFRDLSGSRKRSASGSNAQGRADHREEKKGEALREITGTEGGVEPKSSNAVDNVFELKCQSIRMKTTERKMFPEAGTVASVRNKIKQFEALTQRSQVLTPRRTASVPAQLSGARDGVKKSGSAKAIGALRDKREGMSKGGENAEEKGTGVEMKPLPERSLSLDEVGLRSGSKEIIGNDLTEKEGKSTCGGTADFGKYSRLKDTLEKPLNGGDQQHGRKFYIDEHDSKVLNPEHAGDDMTTNNAASVLLSNSRDTSTFSLHFLELPGVQKTAPSPDGDKTATNTPDHSPLLLPQNLTPTTESENKSTSVFVQGAQIPEPVPVPLLHPLSTSAHDNLHDFVSLDASPAHLKSKKQVLDMNTWLAGLNTKIKVWNDDEDEDDDDDESTQKDDDSNYDSDSGESSVTITSIMSQSDRKSFCVSLSDLCNFAGVESESDNDSDEWQPSGRRSASLSSDMSALSCVSVLASEELDRLLEDVKGLGENTLQDYDDVHVVVLHKEVGVGLGFSLAGGVDQNKPVTVHKVFHTGVAAQEGSIREGDQVLSINGTAMCGYVHWEALRVLRRAKTREMGVVVLRRGSGSSVMKGGAQINNQGPTQAEITETGQRVCVRLLKNSRDLGFSLKGGVDSNLGNRPLSVQKIFQGGPFDKVCPGDELMEIEGMSVVEMRRLEAWTLIRQLPPGPVDVVLRRPIKHLET